jgi:hypothetical protein
MSETQSQTEAGTETELPNVTGTKVESDDVEDEAPEDIEKDELFHLLQNERRRAVVRYLAGRDQTVKMRDVAEQVAAWEHDTTVRALTSDERQRVYIALYQSHLDTLDEAGVIDYNKSRGLVDPRPRLEYVAQYVERTTASDDEEEKADAVDVWDRGYLSLSLVGSVLLGGSILNVTPFQVFSSLVVGALILTMFSLLTVAKVTLDQNPQDGSGTGPATS